MQFRSLIITGLLACAGFVLPVQAADEKKTRDPKTESTKKADVPPPPPAVSGDFQEQDEIKADVTIRRGKDKVIEEYRINGRLYMVRVIPTRGKPYYIRYPEGEHGRVIRKELDDIQTPFWKLFEW